MKDGHCQTSHAVFSAPSSLCALHRNILSFRLLLLYGSAVKGAIHSLPVTAVLNDLCLLSAVLAQEDVFARLAMIFAPFF